eukprot:g20708.t1
MADAYGLTRFASTWPALGRAQEPPSRPKLSAGRPSGATAHPSVDLDRNGSRGAVLLVEKGTQLAQAEDDWSDDAQWAERWTRAQGAGPHLARSHPKRPTPRRSRSSQEHLWSSESAERMGLASDSSPPADSTLHDGRRLNETPGFLSSFFREEPMQQLPTTPLFNGTQEPLVEPITNTGDAPRWPGVTTGLEHDVTMAAGKKQIGHFAARFGRTLSVDTDAAPRSTWRRGVGADQ